MTTMFPQAILFDLDDTIISEGTRIAILLQVAEGLANQRLPLHPSDVADSLEGALQTFWSSSPASKLARLQPGGQGLITAREQVISDTFELLGMADSSTIAVAFARQFSELRAENLQMFPDALETILALKKENVRLGLVTNGAADVQRAKIARFDIAKLFDHVQIEGEHGFGKPDQRAYHCALNALSVAPEKTWMVGDHLEWEVAAPNGSASSESGMITGERACQRTLQLGPTESFGSYPNFWCRRIRGSYYRVGAVNGVWWSRPPAFGIMAFRCRAIAL